MEQRSNSMIKILFLDGDDDDDGLQRRMNGRERSPCRLGTDRFKNQKQIIVTVAQKYMFFHIVVALKNDGYTKYYYFISSFIYFKSITYSRGRQLRRRSSNLQQSLHLILLLNNPAFHRNLFCSDRVE